jgi:hypothetical protein
MLGVEVKNGRFLIDGIFKEMINNGIRFYIVLIICKFPPFHAVFTEYMYCTVIEIIQISIRCIMSILIMSKQKWLDDIQFINSSESKSQMLIIRGVSFHSIEVVSCSCCALSFFSSRAYT